MTPVWTPTDECRPRVDGVEGTGGHRLNAVIESIPLERFSAEPGRSFADSHGVSAVLGLAVGHHRPHGSPGLAHVSAWLLLHVRRLQRVAASES